MSRPSGYTPELAEAVCAKVLTTQSLRSVCRQEGMPAKTTVFRWLQSKPEFRDQYTAAKELGCVMLLEDIHDIADNIGGNVAQDKLRIRTRKWLLSKIKPRKYGRQVAA